MENALRAKPEDIREQYERQLKELWGACGEVNTSQQADCLALPLSSSHSMNLAHGVTESEMSV